MNLNIFSRLPFREQMNIMLNDAVPIGERNDGINRYFLFQLNSFYIEGKYHIELQGVLGIKSFVDTEHLNVYLPSIDISALFI